MPLPKALLTTPLSALDTPSHLVSISSFDSATDGLTTLFSTHVTGALVRGAPMSDNIPKNDAGNFVGMVSILDFIHFFVNTFNTAAGVHTTPGGAAKGAVVEAWKAGEKFNTIMEKTKEKFQKAQVSDVITDASIFLRYAQVSTDTTVEAALKQLGPHKNQRLLVVDDNNIVTNIITQTSLLHYITKQLSNNPQFFEEAQDLLSMELNTVLIERVDPSSPTKSTMKVPLLDKDAKLYSVQHNQLAVEAFLLMASKSITGVAVTHAATGQLLGNLSARDIIALLGLDQPQHSYENLTKSAFECLNYIKNHRVHAGSKAHHHKQSQEEQEQHTPIEKELKVNPTTGEYQVASKLPPAPPKNSVYDNVYQTISSHSTLPKILTITGADTVGFLMFSLAKHRVRRVYSVSGRLLTQGRTAHAPHDVITLSDLIDIFSGNAYNFLM